MFLQRENGSHDKISFSLNLYLKTATLYQEIQQLLQHHQVVHQAQELPKNQHSHSYYFNIPLEHHSPTPWLSTLKQVLEKETTLTPTARLYTSLSSEYDHCGLDIPAASAVFRIQQELCCGLSVQVVLL